MTASAPTPDTVLRLCAASDPAPWYPSDYARQAGLDRDSLDEPLNELRLAGLVRIGGWEAGRGQSYVLTDAGRAAVADGKTRRAADLRPQVADKPRAADGPRSPGRMTAWDRGEAVRKALMIPGPAPVTWTLLILLIFVFVGGYVLAARHDVTLGEYLSGRFKQGDSPVTNRFEVSAAEVSRGEWWRLLTYSLVHGGAMHIIMNGVALMALGPFLEKALGPVRYAILWLLGALGGGVAVVLMSPAQQLARSGALCGLMAAAVVFIWLNRKHLGRRASGDALRRLSTGILLTAVISFSPGISGAGHLGGAIAGLVGGVLLTYHRFGTAEQRWASLLGIVLLPVAGIAPLFEKGIVHWPRQQAAREEPERPPIKDEYNHWVREVWVPTEQVRIRTNAFVENRVDLLRQQSPSARDPGEVAATRMVLGRMRAEQDAIRKHIEQIGPYRAADLEATRKLSLDYFRAVGAVTVAYEACLARGVNWQVYSDKGDTDEMRLQQLLNDALEIALRFWSQGIKAVKAHDPSQTFGPSKVVRHEHPAPAGPSDGRPHAAPRQAR